MVVGSPGINHEPTIALVGLLTTRENVAAPSPATVYVRVFPEMDRVVAPEGCERPLLPLVSRRAVAEKAEVA